VTYVSLSELREMQAELLRPRHNPLVDVGGLPPAPSTNPVEPDWRSVANCVGVDTALFFPRRGDNAGLRAAKNVCAGCLSRRSCLEFGMRPDLIHHGVFGGRSSAERRKLRRDRNRAERVAGEVAS
jgi:hypothetical protein